MYFHNKLFWSHNYKYYSLEKLDQKWTTFTSTQLVVALFYGRREYIPQLYNNKDLSKTTGCIITKTCRVLVHPIVNSRDRQCKLRTRQHLAKLSLASAPLTSREREQDQEHLNEVVYLPCCTSHGRERERARGASPPLTIVSMCIPA
jgi:hypothetical protein